jgi:hypothetical protein
MPEEVWIALTVGARIEALAELKAGRMSERAQSSLKRALTDS